MAAGVLACAPNVAWEPADAISAGFSTCEAVSARARPPGSTGNAALRPHTEVAPILRTAGGGSKLGSVAVIPSRASPTRKLKMALP